MDVDVETLPYDDEAGNKYAQDHPEHDFRNRIGPGRLYLLAESSASAGIRVCSYSTHVWTATNILATHSRSLSQHAQKRGQGGEAGPSAAAAADDPGGSTAAMDGTSTSTVVPPRNGARENAILFRGEPISKLPTARIFKYVGLSATTTPPLGLEWVDDSNVVLVWESAEEATDAFHSMREAGTLEMEEDDEGFLPARPVPETLAPMETRLEKALGKTVQAQEQMWMRWARPEDVKVKGGKSKSKFYERYGENAGKEGQNVFSSRTTGKRKRREYEEEGDDREDLRKRLDAGEPNVLPHVSNQGGFCSPLLFFFSELDGFANGEQTRRSLSPRRGRSASPPRRDRADRSKGRRKLSEYEYDRDLMSRLGPPVGSSAKNGWSVREWDVGKEWETDEFGRSTFGKHERSVSHAEGAYGGRREGRTHRREDGGRRREGRPRLTKEELDAEMDAFLQP